MVMTLKDVRKSQPLTPCMVRLPVEIKEAAQNLAKKLSVNGQRVNETDVYRTAIMVYLQRSDTNSSRLEVEMNEVQP
jgi:hypothetical protein